MATAINLQEKTWEKISQFFKEFEIYEPNTQIEWIEKNIHPIVNNYIYHIDNQQNRDAMNSDINQFIDTKLLPVIRDNKLHKLLNNDSNPTNI
jgi:hypothetical protein